METKPIGRLTDNIDQPFTMLNKYNIYYNCYTDGVLVRKQQDVACFSYIRDNNDDNIVISVSKKHCYYKKSFIVRYLKFLNRCRCFLPINLDVEECDNYFKIKIEDLKDKPKCLKLATFTTIRYLWETNYGSDYRKIPYYTLYINKHYPKFSKIECLHLSHFMIFDKFNSHHSLYCNKEYNIEKNVKNIIKSLNDGNDIHSSFHGKITQNTKNIPLFKNKEELKCTIQKYTSLEETNI